MLPNAVQHPELPSPAPSPGPVKPVRLRLACDACTAAKVRCSKDSPCERCLENDEECRYSASRRYGRRPRAHKRKPEVVVQQQQQQQSSPSSGVTTPSDITWASATVEQHRQQHAGPSAARLPCWDEMDLRSSNGTSPEHWLQQSIEMAFEPDSACYMTFPEPWIVPPPSIYKQDDFHFADVMSSAAHELGMPKSLASTGNLSTSTSSSPPSSSSSKAPTTSLASDHHDHHHHHHHDHQGKRPHDCEATALDILFSLQYNGRAAAAAHSSSAADSSSSSICRDRLLAPNHHHTNHHHTVNGATFPSSTSHHSSSSSPSASSSESEMPPSIDALLSANQAAMARLAPLLECACAARHPHVALLHSSILSKAVYWYGVVGGALCESRSQDHHYQGAGGLLLGGSSSSSSAGVGGAAASLLRPTKIQFGVLDLDADYQKTVTRAVLLRELRRAEKVVEAFDAATRRAAAAGVAGVGIQTPREGDGDGDDDAASSSSPQPQPPLSSPPFQLWHGGTVRGLGEELGNIIREIERSQRECL